eukprot:419961-Prorocentrum_minimum.AAC.3
MVAITTGKLENRPYAFLLKIRESISVGISQATLVQARNTLTMPKNKRCYHDDCEDGLEC